MNVSSDIRAAYKSDSASKILHISFPGLNYTVAEGDIYYESMILNESIFDGDSFEAVGCIASMFSVQIRDTGLELKGQSIIATLVLEDIPDSDIVIFMGYVDSVDKEAQKKMQKITAYDALYSKGQTDVASWYNNLNFPISLRNLRNSLFNYIGITQINATLPNDEITINKEFAPNALKAISVIKSICQINGVFGIMNRQGYFAYRTLNPNVTEEGAPYYRQADYKDYTVNPVDKLTIRQSTEGGGVTVGSGANEYIIQGNMFTYNLSDGTLLTIANNIYPNLSSIEYIPFKITNNGYPWVECGLNCKMQYMVYDFDNATQDEDAYKSLTVFVFNRHMTGIQNLVDEYSAEGQELQREFVSDISEDLQLLQQTVNNLVKNMSSEITTYRNAVPIVINAEDTKDIANMVYVASKGNTVIFHEELSVEVALTTLQNVLYTVRYYVNGRRIDNHISEGTLKEGKNLIHLMQFWEAGSAETNIFQAKLTIESGTVTIRRLRANAYITVKQSEYIDAGIEIAQYPDKMTYNIGELIDYTGLIVNKVYYDESIPSENITSRCAITPSEWSPVTSTDEIEVTVVYSETSELGELRTWDQSFSLNVQYLVGISVEQDPNKTEYWVGEVLNLTGIKVVADYVDGTTKDVTADCTYTPNTGHVFVSSNEGAINISYTENTITVTTETSVLVSEVMITEIKVTTPPNKMEYYAGEQLDLTGIVVEAFYNNNTRAVITNDCVYNPNTGDVLTADNSIVEITYQGLSCTLEPTIHLPSELEVTPDTLSYKEGETLDLSGVTVNLVWDNGAKTNVTGSSTYNPASGSTVTSNVGAVEVAYTFLGETYTGSITIEVVVFEGIEVTHEPNKVEYYVGQALDLTGTVISGVWSDGSKEDITQQCTFMPTDGTALDLDDSVVNVKYVRYETYRETISITVEAIEFDLKYFDYEVSGNKIYLTGTKADEIAQDHVSSLKIPSTYTHAETGNVYNVFVGR